MIPMTNFLLRLSPTKFFLAIDNKSSIRKISIESGIGEKYSYIIVQQLKNLQLVTTKPFQLTKKGELLKNKLRKIYQLIEHGK